MSAHRTMSVGRDYRFSSGYEFVIFRGERVEHRAGGFRTAKAARRAAFAWAKANMIH